MQSLSLILIKKGVNKFSKLKSALDLHLVFTLWVRFITLHCTPLP